MFLLRTKISTAPTGKLLSVEEAKTHARVDTDDDDIYIDSLIAAATNWVQQYTNRVLITQTLEGYADAVPPDNDFRLIPAPIQTATGFEIDSYTTADLKVLFAATSYRVDMVGSRVHLNWGCTWPTGGLRSYDAFYVKWTAGYGASSAVPDGLKHAMRLLISLWYENREPLSELTLSDELKFSVTDLLRPYKVFLL